MSQSKTANRVLERDSDTGSAEHKYRDTSQGTQHSQRRVGAKWIYWTVAIAAIGVAGYAAVWYANEKETPVANDVVVAQPANVMSVESVIVQQQPIQAWIFADGTARSTNREYLTFERSGKINYIKPGTDGRELRQGDPVKAGEVLARMDQRRYQSEIKTADSVLDEAKTQLEVAQAEVAQADTQYQLARTQFERSRNLINSQAISRSEFEEAEAAFKNAAATRKSVQARLRALDAGIASAEAKLDQSKLTLEETDLVSPIDGIVAYLNIEEGFYFTQNSIRTTSETEALQTIPIIVIDPSSYEITVDIPAFEATRVQVGQRVLLTPGNLPATNAFDNRQPNGPTAATAEGTVFSVNPAVNPGGRSVQVVIRSTSGAENLQDGMFTTCWIQVESSDDAIVAPFEAFLFEENQPYVFAIVSDESESGKLVAKRRPVSIGIQGLDSRQILTGVAEGERIATTGRYRLVDGAPVTVIETANQQKPR